MVLNSDDIEFERIKPSEPSTSSELDILKEQLNRLDFKELRIKEAYMNGIDTLEEYARNRELIQSERKDLLEKISDIDIPSPADDTSDQNQEMLHRITNVLDILRSDDFTDEQKNDALRSIIKEARYDKKADKMEVCYYLL